MFGVICTFIHTYILIVSSEEHRVICEVSGLQLPIPLHTDYIGFTEVTYLANKIT